jgi:hypothetical protein
MEVVSNNDDGDSSVVMLSNIEGKMKEENWSLDEMDLTDASVTRATAAAEALCSGSWDLKMETDSDADDASVVVLSNGDDGDNDCDDDNNGDDDDNASVIIVGENPEPSEAERKIRSLRKENQKLKV